MTNTLPPTRLALPAKLAFGLGLALLLLGASQSLYYGLRAAWADVNSLPTRWVVGEWREGRGPASTLELWADSRDELRAAALREPNNPQFFEDLGYLHAARAQSMGALSADNEMAVFQKILYDEATNNFRSAAVLRPSFPYPWAYLAYTKTLNGQRDGEMWSAYDRAMAFGKNEAGVEMILAQVALPQWKFMTDERQATFAAMVANAQATTKGKLLETAAAHQVQLALP